MEHYPDLEGLALFLKVVQAGSFSKVTQQTKIPKSTLSRKISQLEEFYGAQLLVRNTRNLKLTEVGREMHNKAQNIVSLLHDSLSAVQKTKEQPVGLLRVSAGVEYGLSVISPIVEEFMKTHKELNIELDLTGRKVDLIYEGYDLGVRIGPLEDSTLALRKIGSFRYGLFAGQKFFTEHKPISIEKLVGLPKLGFSRTDNKESWVLINKFEKREIRLSPRLLSNNYWVLLNAARANLGVVYMPIFLAEKSIKEGSIVHILPQWSSEEIPIHFVYPAQKYLTSKVRRFIDFSILKLN